MTNYQMPNPQAWLSMESEQLMDWHIPQRQLGDDPFTHFIEVLRRANPLVPPIITGPISSLSTRLAQFWSAVPPDAVQFHGLKLDLLVGFCHHLESLSLFEPNRVAAERLVRMGLRFYSRHLSRDPRDSPFPNAKRDERLEAVETVFFLTLILSTADDAPSVGEAPEGPVAYIPYYTPPLHVTAPKRKNAASLAMAARFFRLDTRPKQYRVFDFDLTVGHWTWSPKAAQGAAFETDEGGYRHIAQLPGKNATKHSAVSYFVLKLLAVMRGATEVRKHCASNASLMLTRAM
jgi:hypothetical protein